MVLMSKSNLSKHGEEQARFESETKGPVNETHVVQITICSLEVHPIKVHLHLNAAYSGRCTHKEADARDKTTYAKTTDKLAQMSVSSGTQQKITKLPPPPPSMKSIY